MASFAPIGILNRPTSPLGWVITLAALAFAAQVGWAVNRNAHSVSDMLYTLYPFWGVTFLGWDWLARRLSRG